MPSSSISSNDLKNDIIVMVGGIDAPGFFLFAEQSLRMLMGDLLKNHLKFKEKIGVNFMNATPAIIIGLIMVAFSLFRRKKK